MNSIYIDLSFTIDYYRSNLIKRANEIFTTATQSPGRSSWKYDRDVPVGVYYQVNAPVKTWGLKVKQLTRALLENNIKPSLVDLSNLGTLHKQIALRRIMLAEEDAWKAERASEKADLKSGWVIFRRILRISAKMIHACEACIVSSLLRRQHLPNHAKVRSTIHRSGNSAKS